MAEPEETSNVDMDTKFYQTIGRIKIVPDKKGIYVNPLRIMNSILSIVTIIWIVFSSNVSTSPWAVAWFFLAHPVWILLMIGYAGLQVYAVLKDRTDLESVCNSGFGAVVCGLLIIAYSSNKGIIQTLSFWYILSYSIISVLDGFLRSIKRNG